MNIFKYSQDKNGLSRKEIEQAVIESLQPYAPRKVLLLPPDFTRLHSNAGLLTNLYYHELISRGASVEIMPALGTHAPVSDEQRVIMFGEDISADAFLIHDWRNDVVRIGEAPASYVSEITEGLWKESVIFEINKRIMDESYDLIISIGQVVPHEIVGMANHGKNLFVGVGGTSIINQSHMIGAVYGMEKMMGRDHTPVRKLFDYGMEHFLKDRPILFALTVTTADSDDNNAELSFERLAAKITTHGLFIGEGRECLTEAVRLAQKTNIDYVDKSVQKCVVYLDPGEFKSTWLGNKAIYRTRMMMTDGGELIILAPGVERFGEDDENDALIRKYGYCGREKVLSELDKPENEDLRRNLSATAHLIHGSTEGRFTVTYAVSRITQEEMEQAGFHAARYEDVIRQYDPKTLKYGYNTVNGEEIYYVPNPALGLWISKEMFS